MEVRRPGRGLRIRLADGERLEADAAFLAVPPPALARLLEGSDDVVGRGFGAPRALAEQLAASVYEHVGVAWFFDRPLPKDLPLGGHNVRRGWHPILVQHDQYRTSLAPPAVSVVVGSVAVDTDFVHPRLGTRADEHSLEDLARIVWEDERLIDPSLPEPIDVEITGLSSATQIVHLGPLPLTMQGVDLFLATNLHGLAPYFTASLESAIQAGAIAAERFDPSVDRLPTGPTRRLPWTVESPAASPGAERAPAPPVAAHAACAESS